ncbi:hypothetical protein CYY_007255 [Polysphondylium violaceum]|uniref:TLDc domain-containing protein n=1 Tax=Polysphondylium violaceum TaxID=133409 RepID=A0A8J4UR04_9MYCE|nr:hypothetical protein CYY_007255 [Polysphondylium violaceum]
MITSNTREDLEKDNARLQKENWEYKKVGCSNTDHISLYLQLETSNNENQRLKQEIYTINQNVNLINESFHKLLEENKKNVDNCNNQIDLLKVKIESLVKLNESLNQQQCTLKEQQDNSLKKIDSLTKANELLQQQLKQQHQSLEFKQLEMSDKVSKTCKDMEFFKQDLMFFKKSKIIENSSFKILNDWIDESKTMDFSLLYRASWKDLTTSSFHSECDDKGATITLIETTDGCVFGGYNSQSWHSDGSWYDKIIWLGDNKCFIFTLVNKHGIKPTKYLPGTTDKSYVAGTYHVIAFGGGYDIGVGQKESYQSFPHTYIDTTGKGKTTLNPTREFTIKTIEIYKCI